MDKQPDPERQNGAPPETDPVAPVRPVITGGPASQQLPPRSVTGSWTVDVWDGFPVEISRVTVRHTLLVQADLACNEVPMTASVRSCPCCGRPWIVELRVRGKGAHTNLAHIWHGSKRLEIAAAIYGIAVRSRLRGTKNPVQEHNLLQQPLVYDE